MRIVITGEDGGQSREIGRALAEYNFDWKLAWVTDPAATASDAAVQDADVLVTGLPDNPHEVQLLRDLRSAHADAVRILLLEPGQEGDAMHLLDRAHRILRKPLDADELIDAVESVIELRLLLDNPELKRVVGQVDSLPSAPRMYIELVRRMADPDVSMATLAQLLSSDPAIAARVLRLCNSAYFSAGREVTDIRTAATRLGQQTLRQVVLASEVLSQGAGAGLDRDAMQQRALRTSQLAAQLLGGSSAELAATAGLLAEVGLLLPMAASDGAPEQECEDADARPAPPVMDQARAEAGAYLLGLWGLPNPIVEAVANQFRPRRIRASGFWVTGAVHVASALVNGREVDQEYLRAVGMLDRLPRWREMAGLAAEAA